MNFLNISLFGTFSTLLFFAVSAQALDPYRGLWVGEAKLTHVNEVSIPLDEENDAIAPDPAVPTPGSDQASLRLILHVNSQGQTHLLKDVAVLQRANTNLTSSIYSSESDLSLVTDERLYPDFPAQETRRIASAVFDFGDAQATRAVDAMVSNIAAAVAASVDLSGITATSDSPDTRAAEGAAELAAIAFTQPVVDGADAASEFGQFLIDNLPDSVIQTIAVSGIVDGLILAAALELQTNSFYGDTRGIDLLDAITNTVNALTNETEKIEAARFITARYADPANGYERFITGSGFGDLIVAGAQAAGNAAAGGSNVVDAVTQDPVVVAIKESASEFHVSAYEDTAAEDGVDAVISAIIASGQGSPTNTPASEAIRAAESAGYAAVQALPRFSLNEMTPTPDYTAFINAVPSEPGLMTFKNSLEEAAEKTAIETVLAKKEDPFSTEESLFRAARVAATEALGPLYVQAALARRSELPLTGTFAPGSGDVRPQIDLNGAALLPAGLSGLIYLPASHPTNPFRHPKHPDHTSGVNIKRLIRLDFNGSSTNPLNRAAFGVDQVTGIYREEIRGLHKPLGPDPVNDPIGLKVEGTFELNRISLIDTLNAQ